MNLAREQVLSTKMFFRSRQNCRSEILDLLKEVQQTLKETSGPVFGGLTLGVSYLKNLPEEQVRDIIFGFIQDCKYAYESNRNSSN